MKNMGDYQDHYLKKYVLLLTAVFERFIDTCLKFQKIDPCHYFSSPGLSSGIELKKIFDIDMQLFIEKELRGGISYIAKSTVKQITNTQKIMILQEEFAWLGNEWLSSLWWV